MKVWANIKIKGEKQMRKKEINVLAEKYGANNKALRDRLKENGYDLKEVNEYQVLKTIYLYSKELLYCRRSLDKTTVEYANSKQTFKILSNIEKARKYNEVNEIRVKFKLFIKSHGAWESFKENKTDNNKKSLYQIIRNMIKENIPLEDILQWSFPIDEVAEEYAYWENLQRLWGKELSDEN